MFTLLQMQTCADCGGQIKGRSDKRFCDDQCRSNFHNRRNSETNGTVKRINHILRKNRRILSELNPDRGKATAARSKMADKGFDFRHFTSIYTTGAGATYYFCYEYGFLPLENELIALVYRNRA
jgi:hypothetical protein